MKDKIKNYCDCVFAVRLLYKYIQDTEKKHDLKSP